MHHTKVFRILMLTISLILLLAARQSAADVQAKIVEYYIASIDAYFITALPDEQSALDKIPEFQRTGMSFRAAPAFQPAPPDYASVCRFYISLTVPFVSSHFYEPGDTNCSATLSVKPAGFTAEGPNFKVPMPIDGKCTAPATAVHRSFRAAANGKTSNHRYSVNLEDQAAAQRAGFVDEGVVFCATGAMPVTPPVSVGDADLNIVKRAQGIYAVSRIFATPGLATDSAFVYSYGNYTADVYSPATAVDGVVLRFGWGAMESARGVYDFRQIVFETKKAAQAGKKIQLLIISGTQTPDQLCPQPVMGASLNACTAGPVVGRPYCFQSSDGARDGSTAGGCKCRVVPVPWAINVQTQFQNMLRALKAALLDQANGGLTDAEFAMIRMVRANGINYQTEELKMPTGTANPPPGGNCDSDTTVAAAWAALPEPYSAPKIVSTWAANVSFVQSLFPNTASSVAVTSDSFVADAAISTGPQAQALTGQFISSKIRAALLDPAQFAGRHFMQVNALSPTFAPTQLLIARDAGIPIAFQTNLWRGVPDKGAFCGSQVGDTTPCTDDQSGVPFLKLLERGLCQGAHYLEIFAPDVARYPNSIAAARAQPFGVVSTCR